MPWAFSLSQARCSCRVGAVLRSGTLCTDPLICNKKSGSLESCRGRSRLFGMFDNSIGCFAPVNPYRFLRSLVDIEGFPASNLPIHRKHFLECFSHLKLLLVKKKGRTLSKLKGFTQLRSRTLRMAHPHCWSHSTAGLVQTLWVRCSRVARLPTRLLVARQIQHRPHRVARSHLRGVGGFHWGVR